MWPSNRMLKNIFTLRVICYFTFCKSTSLPSLGTKFFMSVGLINNSLSCFSIHNRVLNLHFSSILSDIILPSQHRPTNPPCCNWSSFCSETDYLNKVYIIFHVPELTVGSVASNPYANASDTVVITDYKKINLCSFWKSFRCNTIHTLVHKVIPVVQNLKRNKQSHMQGVW